METPTSGYNIRPADRRDADSLTAIAFASKRYWNYPARYLEIWRDELTVSANYIDRHEVWATEVDGGIATFYAIVELTRDREFNGTWLNRGFWLDHMFISPDLIGRDIGRHMFRHLRRRCVARGIRQLAILSDPNARGFYEKMGCHYRREIPSTIAGRTTPLMLLTV